MVVLPKAGSKVYFKNIKNMLKAPYVAYCDFESVISSAEHIPNSYNIYVVNSNGETIYDSLYRGRDCMEKFFLDLNIIHNKITSISAKPMLISETQQAQFNVATRCYLCGYAPTSENKLVRDHDHITGLYRGAAHNKCNLALRPGKNIPVVIHNFRGYDSHLITKYYNSSENISVIAINKE